WAQLTGRPLSRMTGPRVFVVNNVNRATPIPADASEDVVRRPVSRRDCTLYLRRRKHPAASLDELEAFRRELDCATLTCCLRSTVCGTRGRIYTPDRRGYLHAVSPGM